MPVKNIFTGLMSDDTAPNCNHGIAMKRMPFVLIALAALAVCSRLDADYVVTNEGTWPQSWPKELDLLRKQSITLEGPEVLLLTYQIPMTTRGEFEAAWPYLLKLKSTGAPLILVRSPCKFPRNIKAGVVVHCPPHAIGQRISPQAPIADKEDARIRWMYTNYIELIVDGDIVDLNRIQIPANTPIIDERFQKRD